MTSFALGSFLPIVFLFIVVNDILFIRYQIMLKCWEENPSDRPTFAKLKGTMKEMERNHMVSMGYNGDKREFNLIMKITVSSIVINLKTPIFHLPSCYRTVATLILFKQFTAPLSVF